MLKFSEGVVSNLSFPSRTSDVLVNATPNHLVHYEYAIMYFSYFKKDF